MARTDCRQFRKSHGCMNVEQLKHCAIGHVQLQKRSWWFSWIRKRCQDLPACVVFICMPANKTDAKPVFVCDVICALSPRHGYYALKFVLLCIQTCCMRARLCVHCVVIVCFRGVHEQRACRVHVLWVWCACVVFRPMFLFISLMCIYEGDHIPPT